VCREDVSQPRGHHAQTRLRRVLSAAVVDHELDELLVGLPGIALDGP
jgi:hypothetical protein